MKATIKQSKRKKGENGVSLTFKLPQDADSAHVFLDDGKGNPGGFAFSNVEGSEIVLFAEIPAGTYSWKITVRRDGEEDGETEGTVAVK